MNVAKIAHPALQALLHDALLAGLETDVGEHLAVWGGGAQNDGFNAFYDDIGGGSSGSTYR